MKKIHVTIIILVSFCGLVLFAGCNKESELEVKDVDFSFAINGFQVKFDNKTTDAKSYKWDFGDGDSSTEASPTHLYEHKGKYAVTLYATLNNGKTIEGSTILRVSKSSPVNLKDGSLADWDTISHSVSPGAAGGIVEELKYDYNSDYVFIYLKMKSKVSNGDIFDFYLDSDDDPKTGLLTGSFPDGGFDYLMEGQLLLGGIDLFKHKGGQNEFSFDAQSIAEFYTLGKVSEKEGVLEFEVGIARSKITGLSGKGMRFGIMVTKSDWSATLGQVPAGPAIRIDMSE